MHSLGSSGSCSLPPLVRVPVSKAYPVPMSDIGAKRQSECVSIILETRSAIRRKVIDCEVGPVRGSPVNVIYANGRHGSIQIGNRFFCVEIENECMGVTDEFGNRVFSEH